MREICTYGSMRGRAYPTRGVPLYSTPSEFFREDRLVDFRAYVLVRHVAAQALFDGMPHVGVVVNRPHDRRELRVAGGLYSVEHVGQELLPRL